ncbi:adenosine deaminase [Mumia flava]|uniref:Adenosine deaminase n=2 Tax=Mumia flava TaxID=1348852 RepID=A0A2M9BK49_9ACTN|nr:adenosine deaminase [Mumia flava]
MSYCPSVSSFVQTFDPRADRPQGMPTQWIFPPVVKCTGWASAASNRMAAWRHADPAAVVRGPTPEVLMRPIDALPKAHLHLHFTGSMRHGTLVELAERDGVRLPAALVEEWPPLLRATDEKGWFRFQRLYDTARSVLRTPEDVARLVREVAEDDTADGAVWTEIQVDPSGYGAKFGGITEFTDLVLDCVRSAEAATGLRMAVVIASNRTRHPLDARTLARLASQYADRGVIGFGLSNDERRGETASFGRAFDIARRGGLHSMPHGGELRGPDSIAAVLEHLHPDRIGHGVRCVEDPAVLRRIAEAGITLEVCPSSNVALGVYDTLEEVPVRTLMDAGVGVALGADDPLLFGARLAGQYAALRAAQDFSDAELAELARMSIRGSYAPPELAAKALADIDAWLAAPDDRA